MIANIGYLGLLLALACAAYAAVAAALSVARAQPLLLASARRAALLTTPLLTLSAVLLIALLVTGEYGVEYVYNSSNREMPFYLKITGLWGGQAGSLVLWCWLMSAFTTSALLGKWQRDLDLMPAVIVVMMVTLGFFIGLVALLENPFARFWQTFDGEVVTALWAPANAIPFVPENGRGLNPLLRHPGMIIHPPMLYLGFVSFVVPFAFALGALVAKRVDDEWLRTTRRWTVIGWLFLSLGLILGGRWAYDVLGWGGYWGWDPVENAALMPWLTGTAFLHSSIIQEKRGMLKRWNMILIMLTYGLVIWGTFLTRSGVLSSVHSFAASAIGPVFFTFISLMMAASLWLLFRAWDRLGDERQLDGLLSREAAFLLNNLLFLGITVAVFWGTHFPMISELVNGQKITVGPPYYNAVVGPLLGGLLLLMGVAPLTAWRKTSAQQLGRLILLPFAASIVIVITLLVIGLRNIGAVIGLWIVSLVTLTTLLEFARGAQARMRVNGENALVALARLIERNRRRYGGYVIHLGVIVMALGVIGSSFFQMETQGRLAQGEQLTIGRYVMVYDTVDHFIHTDGREVHRATVSVYRDGQWLATLHPRQDIYALGSGLQPMTIPGVRSSLEDDFYVLLVSWESIGVDGATFKVYVNPLVNWVWAGGLVFIFGTLIAVWPQAEAARRVTLPRAAVAQGATD
jgi:cytochrome c-type biogenesis protein CcmF